VIALRIPQRRLDPLVIADSRGIWLEFPCLYVHAPTAESWADRTRERHITMGKVDQGCRRIALIVREDGLNNADNVRGHGGSDGYGFEGGN
jgi:hypothetical protein